MRTILVCSDFDTYKAGDHVEVEDQTALDAIVQGYAVPSVKEVPFDDADAPEKAVYAAPENRTFEATPEVK